MADVLTGLTACMTVPPICIPAGWPSDGAKRCDGCKGDGTRYVVSDRTVEETVNAERQRCLDDVERMLRHLHTDRTGRYHEGGNDALSAALRDLVAIRTAQPCELPAVSADPLADRLIESVVHHG